MHAGQARSWIVFVGFLIVSFILVWFGLKLLLANYSPTSLELVLAGIISVVAGVSVLPSQLPMAIPLGISLIVVGLYFLARAAGFFTLALLGPVLGLASIAAAGLLIFMTLPKL